MSIRRLQIALLLLLAASFVPVVASQPPPPHVEVGTDTPEEQARPEQAERQEDAEASPDDRQPLVLEAEPKRDQPPPRNSGPEQSSTAPAGGRGIDPNWIIALLTFALFCVAYNDWKVNRNLLAAMKTVERAHLSAGDFELQNLGPESVFNVRLKLKNTGRLPATLQKICVMYIINEPLPENPVYSPWVDVGGVIAPGEHGYAANEFENGPALTGAQFAAIDRIPFFVYGAIRYTDGFGVQRETGFGLRFVPTIRNPVLGKRLATLNDGRVNYMR